MSSGARVAIVTTCAIVLLCTCPVRVSAQEGRTVLWGQIGLVNVGHSDSEQGNAVMLGGGVGFQVLPRLVVEGDVHRTAVDHVFGRDQHEFSAVTMTGSVLYRAPAGQRVRVLAGGGMALQRARARFTEPSIGSIDARETLRLLHGRGGIEWDVARRFVIRTEGVLWMGGGLDWVLGARAGVGYRF